MCRAVGDAFDFAAHHFAAGDLGAGAQPQLACEVPNGGKPCHVRAGLGNHRELGGHVNAVDTGEVYSAHPEQRGPQVELRCVPGAAALLALGRLAVVRLQALHLLLDLSVAFGQLRADEVKHGQCLLQGKQMLGAPVA